ncbi:DNA uptake protein ComE-like DNA-binding protein [Chryseobacterium ginsenosidimutans]|uniref:hypothetical protein n=1 Tax=Chryseobacterium ginsenosidimutans TaxID=687846 RepID=UPI002788E675|nr:hypothetical protein [Chryseobacterium ginsenosidimutans]MDQ0592366.1 DNA uptake protein ComE-like DNA-binding protein [Chryseobacterium ginsenosidimutans]
MKSLYIIAFLALSVNIYAQENKKAPETQAQEAPNYKESKEFEAKMMKEAQERAAKKPSNVTLASEQGLEVKQQTATKQEKPNNTGKMLPNTASNEEFLASIPGRSPRKVSIPKSTSSNVQGLPSTATLAEIKKTIPKN